MLNIILPSRPLLPYDVHLLFTCTPRYTPTCLQRLTQNHPRQRVERYTEEMCARESITRTSSLSGLFQACLTTAIGYWERRRPTTTLRGLSLSLAGLHLLGKGQQHTIVSWKSLAKTRSKKKFLRIIRASFEGDIITVLAYNISRRCIRD